MRDPLRGVGARLAAAALVAVSLVAACSELFEEPQQCSFDRDCARFGDARCDIARRVCVPRGTTDAVGPPDAAASDAGPPDALPPSCDVSPKPLEDVPGTIEGDAGATNEVTGQLTLDCTKDWRLRGRLVVRSGAVLTIQAGTTILADKATNAGLVVQPGGRIVAVGQPDAPIVITSGEAQPQPGDWRGVYVLGSAPPGQRQIDGDPILAYGGGDAEDESGALSYVRLEYGAAGLVLGGVGRKTDLDFIQVRRTQGDCFAWVGGTADAKHLVCQYPGDEMFEVSAGYVGRMQFVFGQKKAAGGGHHGLLTEDAFPTVYNATLCGDPAIGGGIGVVFRNGARLDVGSSIVTGWGAGLDAVGALGSPAEVRGCIAFDNGANPAHAEDAGVTDTNSVLYDDDNGFDEIAFFREPGRANRETTPGLLDCFQPREPKPWPATALTDGARTPPNDGFFDTGATFIGAFRDPNDPWMRGSWARFDDR